LPKKQKIQMQPFPKEFNETKDVEEKRRIFWKWCLDSGVVKMEDGKIAEGR